LNREISILQARNGASWVCEKKDKISNHNHKLGTKKRSKKILEQKKGF
jgi:hypothetical protein